MMRAAFLTFLMATIASTPLLAEPLPGTQLLDRKGDIAADMVAGIDSYLTLALQKAVTPTEGTIAPELPALRQRLIRNLGVGDARLPIHALEYIATTSTPALIAESPAYRVYAVRWPVYPGVDGEGLLLEPTSGKAVASIVAIPDANQTPAMLVGLEPGVAPEAQFARLLAEHGCRVVVPWLIDRGTAHSGNIAAKRMTNQPHREFIYRMGFEMGQSLIGLEVQKVRSLIDWYSQDVAKPPIMLYGYGEGGLVAFFAALIDSRLSAVVVSGYHWPSAKPWQEPIDRNLWGMYRDLGAMLRASKSVYELMSPAKVWLEFANWPSAIGRPAPLPGQRANAAPGELVTPPLPAQDTQWPAHVTMLVPGDGLPSMGVSRLATHFKFPAARKDALKVTGTLPVAAERRKSQFDQLIAHLQNRWRASDQTRKQYWSKANSSTPETWQASTATYREYFWQEVIGKLPPPNVKLEPRSRQIYDEPKWTGYEVTLNLYPEVFASGILLLPKGMQPGEKRPVVVCQHGLEGRPTDVVNPKERTKYYNSFGAQLADRGYIVFAPQNPYIGQDAFRVLQRKANPLGLSLFSFIIRQHEVILDWLATQPNVDGDRIGFYGLSYGGKTAMRVPAVLPRYALSICSGDFNEWIGKNVSMDLSSSYMFTYEYEMYEYDLGNTFNYAEMAYLIAPRPFMVERGHDDGVGIDEMVAYEYAKVRYLYANRLKIPDRTAIEWFAGGHEINGKGTFQFLDKHLKWSPK